MPSRRTPVSPFVAHKQNAMCPPRPTYGHCERQPSARMTLTGVGCRLQTCSWLAPEQFDSAFRAEAFHYFSLFFLEEKGEKFFYQSSKIQHSFLFFIFLIFLFTRSRLQSHEGEFWSMVLFSHLLKKIKQQQQQKGNGATKLVVCTPTPVMYNGLKFTLFFP